MQALGVDYIDESEVLTPADEEHHVYKHALQVPFVCGARDLGEALRRIGEGAAMIRTKGEAGTGNVVEAVRHMRAIMTAIRQPQALGDGGVDARGQGPRRAVRAGEPGRTRPARCRWCCFTAGGIATPADAALMMQLGSEGVFVGSGIFKSGDPARFARRHRPGHHPLPGPPDPGRGGARPGRADGGLAIGRHPGARDAAGSAREAAAMATSSGRLAHRRAGRTGRFCRARGHAPQARARGVREVRMPRDLEDLDGLIVPGGESTTIGKLLVAYGLGADPRRGRRQACPSGVPAPA